MLSLTLTNLQQLDNNISILSVLLNLHFPERSTILRANLGSKCHGDIVDYKTRQNDGIDIPASGESILNATIVLDDLSSQKTTRRLS